MPPDMDYNMTLNMIATILFLIFGLPILIFGFSFIWVMAKISYERKNNGRHIRSDENDSQ